MRFKSIFLIAACAIMALVSCGKEKGHGSTNVSAWNGLVINEIAAHDQTTDAVSWVELLNSSGDEMDLSGLKLFITDEYFTNQPIWTGREGLKLTGGARMVLSTADESLVTGISSAAQFVLKLGTADGTAIDTFDLSKAFENPAPAYARGSYQRIPEGSGAWKSVTYHSKGAENKIFDIADFHKTAVWVWSSHTPDMMENDAAKLKNLKALGYDHILLNFAAFQNYNLLRTMPFLEKCEELGINVHAWMQCFYKNGSWISPVDDENKCYKEDVFADIREHAKMYIENFGVKGLHLDYIRFGGTASKHNPTADVTAVGAVNRCCRELREISDSYDEGLVMSAALMPEPNTEYAYGQNPAQMGQYIHILMPMLYRYTYNWSDSGCKSTTNWFCNHSGNAEVWAGITSYTGNDSGGVKGMDADALRKDIDLFLDTDAKGIVLFRYGLGTFPDVNDID